MATEQENKSAKARGQEGRQGHAERMDRASGPGSSQADNGENEVSNGTQSDPPQPGVASVGNTGADEK